MRLAFFDGTATLCPTGGLGSDRIGISVADTTEGRCSQALLRGPPPRRLNKNQKGATTMNAGKITAALRPGHPPRRPRRRNRPALRRAGQEARQARPGHRQGAGLRGGLPRPRQLCVSNRGADPRPRRHPHRRASLRSAYCLGRARLHPRRVSGKITITRPGNATPGRAASCGPWAQGIVLSAKHVVLLHWLCYFPYTGQPLREHNVIPRAEADTAAVIGDGDFAFD